MSAVIALRRAGLSYKEIAREFGVSVDAVKWWLREGFPARRRAQLVDVLDRAIARSEARLAALRDARIENAGDGRADLARAASGDAPAPQTREVTNRR